MSSSSQSGGNITAGFIDLATFDELEKYNYGGADAITYFVRESRRSTWFTHIPVTLTRSNSAEFNSSFHASISRAGDYMLYNWLRVVIPSVAINTVTLPGLTLRWTRNLMHNLVKEFYVSFNDLVEFRSDNYHLDFWTAFTVPASKRVGYNNMIGNFAELINPTAVGAAAPGPTYDATMKGLILPEVALNLPLAHCHTRDSGIALPTAALPYNDMKLGFCFRSFSELLIIDNPTSSALFGIQAGHSRSAKAIDLETGIAPVLKDVQVWANYAIVSNNERKLMGTNPRDILIEQVQTLHPTTFKPSENKSYDIRMSHAIKALFWGVRNKTSDCEWSNYTSASPDAYNGGSAGVNFNTHLAGDPITKVSIAYENTSRINGMYSDYFALVMPYFHAVSIPEETGYHMYSYSLDILSVDPMGSTNYGKLTNVSITPESSTDAQVSSVAPVIGAVAAAGVYLNVVDRAAAGHHVAQTFDFVLTAINHNIVRISGGALGFPVL
jgi:hypothetical protein